MDGNAKDLLDVVKREKVRFEHMIVLFQDSLPIGVFCLKYLHSQGDREREIIIAT